MENKFDFDGYATKNDVPCSDGRTIMKDAFKHNDGNVVPMVWNHDHDNVFAVLGHALLENREDGVYAYGKFNNTAAGQNAKELVENGDISAMSIYANKLKQHGNAVIHGDIREISLVLAGANPEAHIQNVLTHSEMSSDEAVFCAEEPLNLYHSEEGKKEEKKEAEDDETIKAIFETLNEKQKTAVSAVIGMALLDDEAADDEDEEDDETEGGKEMKHNVFENDDTQKNDVLSHSELQEIVADAKKYGSMKESFLAHSVEYADKTQTYGIDGTNWLFPEAHNLNQTPEFIKRDTGWVSKVMAGVHHSPFSRIKSVFADITEDEARAKGYIKGKYKKEEVFSLLKRTTTPTTVYKKQKMDRDDVIDITDFDVVAWIKGEMRMMLDEELARAFLIGDGRLGSSDDKINEQNIRPIWKEEDLFTVKVPVTVDKAASDQDKAKELIKKIIKSRKLYKGSGNPTFFTTEDTITDMLLIEDTTGRRIYNSVADLATTLRVKEIVAVEVMENCQREAGGETFDLVGLIVNLSDYNVGADKGGAINMFDDFDIDYNQMKYLIETRCSGALTKPFSALAIEYKNINAAG